MEDERTRERSDIHAPAGILTGKRTGTTAACMAATRRRKRIFVKRLTAVMHQPRELSQSAGCTNKTWEEDQIPSLQHRDCRQGRRRIRRTSSPRKVHADDLPARPEPNEPIETDVIYSPYTRYPRRLHDLICVLTPMYYVVSCSVGPDPRNLRQFSAVFDTGSGLNLIQKSTLFDVWKRYLVQNETLPRPGDGNGRPLRLLCVARIRTHFSISVLHLPFVVAASLAADVIIGTRFINQHVDALECRRQCVMIHRDCVLPILARNSDRTFTKTNPRQRRTP